MTLRPAAFFDFDRTVIHGDAGIAFGVELMRLGRRRARDDRRGTLGWVGRNLWHEARTLKLLGLAVTSATLTRIGLVKRSRTIRTGYRQLRGFDRRELAELARDYFTEVLRHRIYPQARAAMESHRAAGRPIVVASTGMHEIIDPVKRFLPVDDVVAVRLLDRDGTLTGEAEGPMWGVEKATAVRAYAHAHGLSLPKSWAYSDHHSDVAFLQLVGRPVVVNPTLRLRRIARRKRWPIERWTLPVETLVP